MLLSTIRGRVVHPGVFNKTILFYMYPGLLDIKHLVITNSALCTSLVIYHFISSVNFQPWILLIWCSDWLTQSRLSAHSYYNDLMWKLIALVIL